MEWDFKPLPVSDEDRLFWKEVEELRREQERELYEMFHVSRELLEGRGPGSSYSSSRLLSSGATA